MKRKESARIAIKKGVNITAILFLTAFIGLWFKEKKVVDDEAKKYLFEKSENYRPEILVLNFTEMALEKSEGYQALFGPINIFEFEKFFWYNYYLKFSELKIGAGFNDLSVEFFEKKLSWINSEPDSTQDIQRRSQIQEQFVAQMNLDSKLKQLCEEYVISPTVSLTFCFKNTGVLPTFFLFFVLVMLMINYKLRKQNENEESSPSSNLHVNSTP